MARISNTVITILNIVTATLAVAAIATFIYLRFFDGRPSHCERTLEKPVLISALVILAVSLFGLIGSCCRATLLLWVYLFVVFLMILGWFSLSVFVFVVTNKGAAQAVSRAGFREYRLGDYSHWLQNHVVNGKNWEEIRSCLVDAKICKFLGHGFDQNDQNATGIFNKNLSPVQSGCCKPPSYCGFTAVNATYWTVPVTGPATPDSDCETWSNNQQELCYDCKSCKAGVLNNIRNEWRSFAIFNAIILVGLLIVYATACCAATNNRRHRKLSY
ncbi:hypothetical protein Nepgr_033428 [Nepenthes gracilis]|uniref:Tetraspanin-8 n=1 Tax=Nepenthes gracilis TaxID=150966 RepID=A0AAD3TLV6_NEPGR|nr:hypothetical protein Nepgr_033428 [Nepenthes gracilis]